MAKCSVNYTEIAKAINRCECYFPYIRKRKKELYDAYFQFAKNKSTSEYINSAKKYIAYVKDLRSEAMKLAMFLAEKRLNGIFSKVEGFPYAKNPSFYQTTIYARHEKGSIFVGNVEKLEKVFELAKKQDWYQKFLEWKKGE